jgi:hypothetical protein
MIVGEFVQLDHTGTMILTEAIEHFNDHTRKLPVVLIPLQYVQVIEMEN